MKRVTTEVESLMFESTPVGLARQLCCRGGIQDVEVDARAGTATIDYDDQGLAIDDVLRFIAESGYCVSQPSHSRAAGPTECTR